MRTFPRDRLEQLTGSIELHRGQPHITLAAHVRKKMADLGQSVLQRQRIYMDQKYWVLLRDAAMDRPRDPAYLDVLLLLRRGTASGSIICPIGENVFLELLKQSDVTTRQVTSRLIDDLSLGVTIECSLSRMTTEIRHFLSALTAGNPRPGPPIHLVWTNIAHVIGAASPVFSGIGDEEMLAMQKAFDDFLWSVSLDEMLSEAGIPGEDLELRIAASKITAASAAHASEMRSFKRVFLAEVGGVLDASREAVSDAFEDFLLETYAGSDQVSMQARRSIRETSGAVLYNIFRYDKMGTALPLIHITASLFALARWNRTPKFDSTDFYDFSHAASALPYCDYFLTEKPLAVMLTSRPLELDRLYRTKVIHSVEDAIQELSSK